MLLRHGESEWNKPNLFTGWWDAPLTEGGGSEAVEAGRLMAEPGSGPTSSTRPLQTRAIRTAELALDAMGRLVDPGAARLAAQRAPLRRAPGARNKAETAAKYGDDQVKIWRRSYDIPPPPLEADDEFDRSRDDALRRLPPGDAPADGVPEGRRRAAAAVLVRRHRRPTCAPGGTVLVAAHGNSLRALVKHLDGISDDDIVELNIPTGEPLVYELGEDLRPIEDKPVEERYLRSPAEIREAAAAVARQAQGG